MPYYDRQCVICASAFVAYTSGKYCSNPCRRQADANRTRAAPRTIVTCVVCAVDFKPRNKQNITCGPVCRAKHRKRSNNPYTKPEPQPERLTGHPCATCVHGVASLHSDTGWLCNAYLALKCKPLGPTPLHYQRW